MSSIRSTDFSDMQFLCSAPHARAFPQPQQPEIAFAGRSNAGKSSALNAICGRTGLARISKTPGRTQAINFFDSPALRFADLPGYGFARVPPAKRAAWQTLMEGYIGDRHRLIGLVLIMDVRRPLLAFDHQLLDWGLAFGLRFHLLLTKADKLSRNRQLDALRHVERETQAAHTVQLFSASKRQGIDQARAALAAMAERDTNSFTCE